MLNGLMPEWTDQFNFEPVTGTAVFKDEYTMKQWLFK